MSTGFRAPSLQQQFFAAAATNNIGGVLVDAVTLPVNNPVAVALGATPLKAEKSFSWSAGAVFDKVDGLNVTVDYYNIKINDRIVLTENLQGADVVAILQAAGVVDLGKSMYLAGGSLNWAGHILGGLMFGFGMIFTGGCPSRRGTTPPAVARVRPH